jgi:hypothetical protein
MEKYYVNDEIYILEKNSPRYSFDWYGFKYKTTAHTDGGVKCVHKGYLEAVNRLGFSNKIWENGLDWCAGDGGLGLMFLGSGKVNNITFIEPYKLALDNLYFNLENNGLDCKVFEIDNIASLTGKYDVVFANAPSFKFPTLRRMTDMEWLRRKNYDPITLEEALEDLHSKKPHRTIDFEWNIHKEFFKNITNNLNLGADVFLFENADSINPLFWEWGETKLKLKQWVDNNQIKEFTYPQVALHFVYE